MAFLDGSAESGMVFKGDLCLAEKSESITVKRRGCLLPLFSSSARKG